VLFSRDGFCSPVEDGYEDFLTELCIAAKVSLARHGGESTARFLSKADLQMARARHILAICYPPY